jgi:uncharacterized protein with NRDE domain
MCLILFAGNHPPEYRLILAANRDEFYERPTAPAGFWPDCPEILAGKDLQGGGTWLGVSRSGRLAAVTNYRDPASLKSDAPSRGALVSDFLTGRQDARQYLGALRDNGRDYNGFNLIVFDGTDLCWYSNRGHDMETVPAGIHGVSNALLDTDWPKVEKGMRAMKQWVESPGGPDPEAGFRLLSDARPASDHRLPRTGVGLEWERILSPIFIASPVYGTRASTIVAIRRDGRVSFVERGFGPNGPLDGPGKERRFEFAIEPPEAYNSD